MITEKSFVTCEFLCKPVSLQVFFFNTMATFPKMTPRTRMFPWRCFLYVFVFFFPNLRELLDNTRTRLWRFRQLASSLESRLVADVRVRSPLFAAAPTWRPTPSASASSAPTMGKVRAVRSREESQLNRRVSSISSSTLARNKFWDYLCLSSIHNILRKHVLNFNKYFFFNSAN